MWVNAIAGDECLGGDAGQPLDGLAVDPVDDDRYERRSGVHDTKPELAGETVAQIRSPRLGVGQATSGHHEGAAREGVETCFHHKAVSKAFPLAHGIDAASDDEFSACSLAFCQQHVDDLLRRFV